MRSLSFATALIIWFVGISHLHSQSCEFFYLYPDSKELPVLVRGNLNSGIILLFVQGGPGNTAIDFARIDYPYGKESIEKKVAVAYFDQRGLNKRPGRIDSTKIDFVHYGDDLINLANYLSEKYVAKIFLFGHSFGGMVVTFCMAENRHTDIVEGVILANTPFTTDHTPERFLHYRPLYLINLAREKIESGTDTLYWGEALRWMKITGTLKDRESEVRWNRYVQSAFEPYERKIGILDPLKVIFSRPYNPFTYLSQKDNRKVADLMFAAEASIDFLDLTQRINKDVLLITGRYDDIAPPEESGEAAVRMKRCRFIVIQDAGHDTYLDQPQIFADEILRFIGLGDK